MNRDVKITVNSLPQGNFAETIYGITFWAFVVVKMCGSILAAWSWWWVFLPFVPWLGYLVQRLHL